MIAPQNAETSAIQENYTKFRGKIGKIQEKSGKLGKIRENSGKFGKFGKIRENSGRAGEEPGNRKFRQKTEKFSKKNQEKWGKTCPKCNFIEF